MDQAMPNALHNGCQASDGFTPSNEADHRIANSLAVISGLVRVRAGADRGRANETLSFGNRRSHRNRCQSAPPHRSPEFGCHRTPHISTRNLPEAGKRACNNRRAFILGFLPAKISVSCNANPADAPAALLFTYEDDGVGFPEDFDISNDENLGMRFIRSLSDQLHGTQKWISDPLGVHFELSLRCKLPV